MPADAAQWGRGLRLQAAERKGDGKFLLRAEPRSCHPHVQGRESLGGLLREAAAGYCGGEFLLRSEPGPARAVPTSQGLLREAAAVKEAKLKRGPASATAASKAADVGVCAPSRAATSPAKAQRRPAPGAAGLKATWSAPSRSSTVRRPSVPRGTSYSTDVGFSAPPPPPVIPCCSREQREESRNQRNGRFNDYWYKITILGSGAVAFLYQVLKSDVEKEVDRKLKQKELQEKDRLLMDKQQELNKKDLEIDDLKMRLDKKARWWFF